MADAKRSKIRIIENAMLTKNEDGTPTEWSIEDLVKLDVGKGNMPLYRNFVVAALAVLRNPVWQPKPQAIKKNMANGKYYIDNAPDEGDVI